MAKKQQAEQPKPKEILELEKYYDLTFGEFDTLTGGITNSYTQDEAGNVAELYLKEVPDIIPLKTLTHVEVLHLSFIENVELSALKDWKRLTELHLTGIDTFRFDYKHVNQVEILWLSNESVLDLKHLTPLKKLKELVMFSVQPINPSLFSSFRSLNRLNIHYAPDLDVNQFPTMPSVEILELDACGLTSIEGLSDVFPLLKYLSIFGNQVSDISPISGLKSLESLNINLNEVVDLLPLTNLKNLKNVWAVENNISVVPEVLFKRLDEFLLLWNGQGTRNNPIVEPPVETYYQGKEAILNWFEEQKKGERPLNEVRMMLIGHGEAGKTSLMRRLTEDGYNNDEETTHGINLETWMVKKGKRSVKVNLWDFGGQQMQHSVHKFFLSDACLYVLVADNRKEDDPQYWLEHIRTLAKNAPVLVVYNKHDQNPDEDISRKTLRDRYPNIIGFHNVSCKSGYGIQDLRKNLQEQVLWSDHASRKYPVSWFNVKNKLEEATGEGKHHISYRGYEIICEEQGIEEPDAQRNLLNVLASVGTVSFFDDPELDKLQILNPEWITEGVYRIVTDDRVGKRRGDITMKDLPAILRPEGKDDYVYTKAHYPYLLALMKKFELCHVREDGHILIPARFSTESKADYADYRGEDSRLYFFFYRSFLPLSIIHRFITRHLRYAVNEDYWYRGIVIKDPTSNTEAFVELNEKEKRIYLWIKGEDIVGYWGYLRREIQELNDFFSGIEYDEYVALDKENRGKEWVKYSNLQRTLSRGRTSYYDPTLDQDIDVLKYLSLFDGEKARASFNKGQRNMGEARVATRLRYIDDFHINISPQFHQIQHQHQENKVELTVIQKTADDVTAKLNNLLLENDDEVARNRLQQVLKATEQLEKEESNPRNAKRSGLLDRYTGFMNQLKAGGEWVNTINDATNSIPELTGKMQELIQHFV